MQPGISSPAIYGDDPTRSSPADGMHLPVNAGFIFIVCQIVVAWFVLNRFQENILNVLV